MQTVHTDVYLSKTFTPEKLRKLLTDKNVLEQTAFKMMEDLEDGEE